MIDCKAGRGRSGLGGEIERGRKKGTDMDMDTEAAWM